MTTKYLVKFFRSKSYKSKLESTHFKFLEYFIKYEQRFRLISAIGFRGYHPKTTNNLDPNLFDSQGYPRLFSRSSVSKLQSQVLYKFQGGRDLETGARFIDLYKVSNPDRLPLAQLNSLTEEQLIEKILPYIERHHWRTSMPLNKYDGRIRALVGLYNTEHGRITGLITTGGNRYKYFYENRYRDGIKALLEGKAPSHWDPQYISEFNRENKYGENLVGVAYLYYYGSGFKFR